jgi:Tfp pilus assembly protein PilF
MINSRLRSRPRLRRVVSGFAAAGLVAGVWLGGADLPVEARDPKPGREVRRELDFAAEMAGKGLWREALFRWNKAHAARPDDARILNNMAVAHEALGQREEARKAYEQAMELGPAQEISANFVLFLNAVGKEDETAAPGPDGEGGNP